MTVIVQPMPWQRTAAMSLSLHGGIHVEPDHLGGLAGMTCEMVQRGAGPYSSRELVAVQDNLGIDSNSGVSSGLTSFTAAMPADSIMDAISIHAEIVRRPHLPADQLDDARMMGLQELRAMEDEPTHRVMRKIRERHYGKSLGRSSLGTAEGLAAITQDDIRNYFTRHYHAGDAIFSVAGNVEIAPIVEHIKATFGDWKTESNTGLPAQDRHPGYEHIHLDSSQTHIGFSFPSIPFGHDEYFVMRAGIGILSDGMSSRLFDRVREKRGLCYTVSASSQSLKSVGGVIGYAGTTPERAQETLDVTLAEIAKLKDGLEEGELDRWKVRIQSSLIMEQESSVSRASSLASDLYQIGRVLTTEELETAIEAISLDQIRDYWSAHPPRDYIVVTLGENPLKFGN
ncbi:Peptidase M16 inactive domain protein [Rubripirellula amarantea]|uniref:Peptidase M16 inactive domain protein n=1 Tax=Rubripirellula amarantea TaxID=2527999 RepID=A0A5C5WHQ5_9BACT|nr:pitrilysin family protein [Rubripirellula amarantea]TWT50336.1 Peptidase M16 inactive domain protein [Rubripirellula amarantea]